MFHEVAGTVDQHFLDVAEGRSAERVERQMTVEAPPLVPKTVHVPDSKAVEAFLSSEYKTVSKVMCDEERLNPR